MHVKLKYKKQLKWARWWLNNSALLIETQRKLEVMDKFLDKAKTMILGKEYSISFAFISDTKMKELNKKYRKINKTTDILSFYLDENEGEILISKKETARKAKFFKMKVADYTQYLLIHGLLHLKGMLHSSKMESKEREFCRKLGVPLPDFLSIHEQKNYSRNRYRNPQRTGNNNIPRSGK